MSYQPFTIRWAKNARTVLFLFLEQLSAITTSVRASAADRPSAIGPELCTASLIIRVESVTFRARSIWNSCVQYSFLPLMYRSLKVRK